MATKQLTEKKQHNVPLTSQIPFSQQNLGAPQTFLPPPPKEYFIIQKINNTYLTAKKNGSVIFEPLHKTDLSCQKWNLFYSATGEKHYAELNFTNVNEIVPVSQPKMVLCFNETADDLILKPDSTKSMCPYWEIAKDKSFDDYRVYSKKVYINQHKILSAKFLGKVSLYDPFKKFLASDLEAEEADYLTVQTSPVLTPIFTIKAPVVSYDFDGVLHLSVKMDLQFHEKLEKATYHPINFMTDKLVPFKEMLDQLVEDYRKGSQIIIVTARSYASDKFVRQFLVNQGVNEYVDDILYISNKTPFLKAINVLKHYDDSPKQIIPMMKAGVNVIPVDPPLNRFWIPK